MSLEGGRRGSIEHEPTERRDITQLYEGDVVLHNEQRWNFLGYGTASQGEQSVHLRDKKGKDQWFTFGRSDQIEVVSKKGQ